MFTTFLLGSAILRTMAMLLITVFDQGLRMLVERLQEISFTSGLSSLHHSLFHLGQISFNDVPSLYICLAESVINISCFVFSIPLFLSETDRHGVALVFVEVIS